MRPANPPPVRHRTARGRRHRFAPQPLQIRSQISRMLVTRLAVLLQRLVDDPLKLRRHFRIQSHRRHRRAIQNRFENHASRFPAKWRHSGSHLVEHHAERKKIAARVQFFRAHLLRRHIRDGPQRAPRTRQIFRRDLRRILRRRHGSSKPSAKSSPTQNPESWRARAMSRKYSLA